MKIILKDFQDVNTFTKGIEFFDGHIDVRQKHHLANARSFLQMCSLELEKPLYITIITDDVNVENDFYNYIKKWEIRDDSDEK